MQIAQVLAGYSLADADLLRRAMGKKKPEEMAKQREVFLAGAIANGVEQKQADHIFSLMEKFAGYGFNKPHSVCYALIAYQTAWLKHYFPADFMASVLSADMQTTDKVVINVEECRDMGLSLLPPDINRGEFRFVAQDPGSVVYGLGAIKGLGEGAVESIVASRKDSGRFDDLFSFCDRLDLRKVNKKAIDVLIGSGALDELVGDGQTQHQDEPGQGASSQGASSQEQQIDYKRALLYANQEDAVQLAEQKARNADSGHTDLFGEISLTAADSKNIYSHTDSLKCLTLKARLEKERDTLGFYLTGHPMDLYKQELKYLAKTRIGELRAGNSYTNNSYANNSYANKDEQTIAGLIVDFRTMRSRKGDTIAFLTLDDRSGRVEVSVFGDLLNQHREKLTKDSVIVVKGTTAVDEYTGGVRMRAIDIYNLVDARENNLTKLQVNVCSQSIDSDFSDELASILSPFKGPGGTGCRVAIEYARADARAEIILGEEWRVKPDDDLIQNLRDRYGKDQVHLVYS